MSEPKSKQFLAPEDTTTTQKDNTDWSVADRAEWVEQYVRRASDAFDKRIPPKNK